jgi:predicted dehydrogenase
MKPVELLIVGAGSRGTVYAEFASDHPEQARVVGVAEPRSFHRQQMAERHAISPENAVEDWRQFLQRPKCADAVVIALQDALHAEATIAFAQKGYDILLEKPMAPDPESCQRIIETVLANNIIFAVCHVLCYTNYTQRMKNLVTAGGIGDILSIQHLEPVGHWHYAHSYVRGNWRNEAESSFMLLAKSCHDIDWLRYMMGRRCVQVSSFGSLKHFRKAEKPASAGAATRCLDCAYEADCPYSAKRLYLGHLEQKRFGWPLNVITTDMTYEGVTAALRTGPYGRCVYECDNDVVDHQVVNLLYDNGATASFTMIATSEMRDRETIIFGTRGELRGNGHKIVHYDFLSEQTTEIPIERLQEDMGHGGGDYGVMRNFVSAVAQRDPGLIITGPLESLESHLTVFAAERARREGRIIAV